MLAMLYRRSLQLQIIAAFAPRLLSGASSIVVSGRVHYNNPGHGGLWVGPHQSRKESGELKHNIIKKQERGIKNIYIFTLLNSSLVLFFGRLFLQIKSRPDTLCPQGRMYELLFEIRVAWLS